MALEFDEIKKKYKFHEETESFFELKAKNNIKPYTELSLEEAREANLNGAKLFGGETEFDGTIKEYFVPSIDCEVLIPVTVYRSRKCSSVVNPSVFIYFHGGGNVVGTRQTVDTICKIFSRDAPCVVVNVEYRLGPEHRFPASCDDAKCVVRWAMMNKGLLGTPNNSVVGVGGDSAGGRLAAVVCHEVENIAYQVLIYPSIDFRRHLYKSTEEFTNMPGLTMDMVKWFNDRFIDESDFENPRAYLPPTLFILAELDMLKDQGVAYHEKLKEAGVKSQTFTVKGVPHGFFHLP
ncbi:hypothetical protein KUTeg_013306, partial [Tegillarca granosa]